jgi:hypothetical protein
MTIEHLDQDRHLGLIVGSVTCFPPAFPPSTISLPVGLHLPGQGGVPPPHPVDGHVSVSGCSE